MTAYIHHNTTVYDSESGEEFRLTEDGDGFKFLCVKASGDYWGKVDFTMSLDAAEALAKAMLAQCQFIRDRDD